MVCAGTVGACGRKSAADGKLFAFEQVLGRSGRAFWMVEGPEKVSRTAFRRSNCLSLSWGR